MDSEDEKDFEPKEIDNFLKTALTFSPEYNPNSYDPSTTMPSSGDDFLQYVMYETAKCEKVVTANLDESKFNKKCRFEINSNDNSKECLSKTAKNLIPTIEWQNDQIKLFINLRDRLDSLREKNAEKLQEMQNNKTVEWSVSKCKKTEPSLLDAIRIRQPRVVSFVHSLIDVVEELNTDDASIPRHLGVWLYTALALLQIPLLPDTCSSLRQLARKCIQLRAALPVEKQTIVELVEPLNLFLCLVARYFNQIDLADKDL